jgi:hypothetical protein
MLNTEPRANWSKLVGSAGLLSISSAWKLIIEKRTVSPFRTGALTYARSDGQHPRRVVDTKKPAQTKHPVREKHLTPRRTICPALCAVRKSDRVLHGTLDMKQRALCLQDLEG